MVERPAQFERRQFPFGGFGAEIIGIVFLRAAEPGDEIPVFNGELSIPDPVLQFSHGQWTHLICNQNLQCVILSQTTAEFQAACSPECPSLCGGRTFRLPPLFIWNTLLKNHDSGTGKPLLKRIQNCPTKRIRSNIKT